MVLVVGGVGHGQAEYAAMHFPPQEVLMDLHEHIRVALKDEAAMDELLERAVCTPCVVCNEVGCGVVPMERAERIYREQVGRACCILAEKAEKVVRLYSGIPTVLKEITL